MSNRRNKKLNWLRRSQELQEQERPRFGGWCRHCLFCGNVTHGDDVKDEEWDTVDIDHSDYFRCPICRDAGVTTPGGARLGMLHRFSPPLIERWGDEVLLTSYGWGVAGRLTTGEGRA